MYQRIYGCDWRNIWLVGDLHGCFARLMAALRERKFDPYQDLLLSVGDERRRLVYAACGEPKATPYGAHCPLPPPAADY